MKNEKDWKDKVRGLISNRFALAEEEELISELDRLATGYAKQQENDISYTISNYDWKKFEFKMDMLVETGLFIRVPGYRAMNDFRQVVAKGKRVNCDHDSTNNNISS